MNGGSCVNGDDDFVCHCQDGFSGRTCEISGERGRERGEEREREGGREGRERERKRERMILLCSSTDEAAPLITTQPAPQEDVQLNSMVTLLCEASGFPRPTIAWFLEGERLEETTPSLTFSATPQRRGLYYCRATNSLGAVDSDSALVTISGEMVFVCLFVCLSVCPLVRQSY